ncbi:UNVERIFIED_CONTAM: hypothetical protein GTU68_017730 [Idotea baltica]|nr:hypothetical protein [Idotea baltica]
MFNKIAGNYDFLNHFLSLGIDKIWRKNAIKAVASKNPKVILDMATGTADLAIEMSSKLDVDRIVGLDIAQKMLDVGQSKIDKKKIQNIELHWGDSEDIIFDDQTFDATTVAFGVRNFEHPLKGLQEIHRVLKIDGQLVVLEFSKPRGAIFGALYNFYFRYVLPVIGRLLSKDPRAYTYLHESVQAFPDYEGFTDLMKSAGFNNCTYRPLTFGICCIYTGIK